MQSYFPTQRYALAGVRRVLVAEHAAGTRFVFADPTIPRVTSLVPAPAAWYALTAETMTSATQVGTRTLNGLRYEQKLSLTWATGFSLYQRRAVPQLFDAPVWVLLEDAAGTWWLTGQTRGLRCVNLTWQTGQRNGEITVSAQLEGAEPAAWYAYDSTAASALYSAAVPSSSEPLGHVDPTGQNGGSA